MREIVVIAHNVRSCHNVGSLLRTAEGLGITKVYLTGYTPYPVSPGDERLPHLAQKIAKQISKTALGSEDLLSWEHSDSPFEVVGELVKQGYEICAIEQTSSSIKLPDYNPSEKVALILGREVEGIEAELLSKTDKQIEIPMFGKKESFNVVQAAAMALYHCRFAK